MADNSSTAASIVPSHHKDRRRHLHNIDLISSLPDEILQHILFFVPTKLAIKTSVLSRRWRHVWCDTPCLSFDDYYYKLHAAAINETLTRYTAPKMMKFHLYISMVKYTVPDMDRWIEFAMSRNVENLILHAYFLIGYEIPKLFYINSSIKELNLAYLDIAPRCSVSWTSLKKLSLIDCVLPDEYMANILSGCPILESLTLYDCNKLTVLDLSKSLRLRTLNILFGSEVSGQTQIVAPHVHCLMLENTQSPCTLLVDVSSLTEANVEIAFPYTLEADLLQVVVRKMLKKLENVEKLTFWGNFLQTISLAEVCGVPFPMLKMKALTLDTEIFQYVIPGIERLLQNSPYLKTMTVHARQRNIRSGDGFDNYLNLQGLNPDQCWRSKDGVCWNGSYRKLELNHVASFVELVLKNTKRLDKMVVQLNERYHWFTFEELVQTLPHNHNVSIVLSS